MPAVLALLDGHVEVASARGTRQIAAADFFLGPLESSLAEDEMAVGASFRRLPAGTGTAFVESARRHGDYALAGVAAAVTAVDGVVTGVRLSFVSVTPTPDVLDLTEAFAGRAVRRRRLVRGRRAGPPARRPRRGHPRHAPPTASMLVGVLTTRALAAGRGRAPPATLDTDTDGAPQAGTARKACA